MKVAIDICCNDPDNGLFASRASGIQLGGDLLELESCDMVGPRMRVDDEAIYISNRKWPVVGSKEWIGNWCWNRYWMQIDLAVEFFAWLHKGRRFDVSQGDERLFNAWQNEIIFPVYTFRTLLERRVAE